MKHQKIIWFSLILLISTQNVQAQKEEKLFRDTLDGAFDISNWLLNLHGFLPLVAPITEPAVGYGGAGVGAYFVKKDNKKNKKINRPDILGVGGGLTENGTWFAGGGYFGFWNEDKIRYRGLLGFGHVNLLYFGLGDGYLAANPIKFNIESLFFLQQALFRINNTPLMLGGRYIFSKSEITSLRESQLGYIDPSDMELTNSGIGIISEFETFNNLFSPTQGCRLHLSYNQMLKLLGSDRDNARLSFFGIKYFEIMNKWSSGFRVESKLATQNTAFYMMPFINLRGIPALRYQGQLTMLVETEQMFNIYRRWSMVGFGGFGTTIPDLSIGGKGENAYNYGLGFRYLVSRGLNLQSGVDVGIGPETYGIYIVFGSAWLK